MSDFIKSAVPFFNKLTKEEQSLISNNIYCKKFNKGSIIHAGSEDCTGLFLLEEGVLRSYILSESGKEITLYRLYPRDICIFSAACLMKNISFDVFIESMTDVKLYVIPTDVYDILQKTSLPVADYTNQLMASRFSDVIWVMEQVISKSFDKRLANFLLELSDIEQSNKLAITHEIIARNLGTAREVVSRMLKYFEENGYVVLGRGTITLLDTEKLYELSK